MSTPINDGGAAFPCPISHTQDGVGAIYSSSNPGMALRDYFAGQALMGRNMKKVYATWQDMSVDCYEIADAMLKARKGKE